jgi:DNA repair exonuclease SbcCD ATPase subunit
MSSQRVNIQYSVTMEELPAEINRLVQRIINLQKTFDTSLQQLNTTNSAEIWSTAYIEEIQNSREKLVQIDHSLQDIEALVASYLRHAIAADMDSQPQVAKPAAPQLPPLSTLDNLIEQFQAQADEIPDHTNEISSETSS